MYAITIFPDGRTSFRTVASADDLVAGETASENPPQHSLSDYVGEATSDIQSWLDATASQNNYDSLASCISYINSTVPRYRADATAGIAWRDAVWQACFAWQQSAASSPPATIPTSAEVIAQLPQPEQFGWVTHQPGSA